MHQTTEYLPTTRPFAFSATSHSNYEFWKMTKHPNAELLEFANVNSIFHDIRASLRKLKQAEKCDYFARQHRR